MGAREDKLLLARADLRARLDRLRADMPRLATDQIAMRAEAIRRAAHDYGMAALERVAAGLGAAIAERGRGALVGHYIETMRDATGCDRADAAAGEAYLATVAVRFAG